MLNATHAQGRGRQSRLPHTCLLPVLHTLHGSIGLGMLAMFLTQLSPQLNRDLSSSLAMIPPPPDATVSSADASRAAVRTCDSGAKILPLWPALRARLLPRTSAAPIASAARAPPPSFRAHVCHRP